MDSFITTFHIDWKIIIAQAVNFGIVIAVLHYFALKPLKKLMAERAERIANGIEDAKCNTEIIKTTRKEYNDVIAKARAEAHDIFTEGKKEAEIKKAEMLEKAKVDVEELIANGKRALEHEKVKMVEEAKSEIVSLVVFATEKLLHDNDNNEVTNHATKQVKHI